MISHSTIKMVLMFTMTAVFINLINYIFCIYYDSADKGQPAMVIEPRTLGVPSSTSDPDESLLSIVPDTSLYTSDGRNAPTKHYLEHIGVYKPCLEIPPGLGPILFKKEYILQPTTIWDPIVMIMMGGHNKIISCVPNEKAAIIVPISPSSTVPMDFVNHMHAFLRKQLLEYQLFIVQSTGIYNRGLLFNAVFKEIQKRYPVGTFHCFIFHEPSMIPVDTRNIYRCSWYPRQLVALLTDDENARQEESTFGGAIALLPEHLITVNGFSNIDDCFGDMAKRLLKAGYTIERVSPNIGQFVKAIDLLVTPQVNVSEIDRAQTEAPSSPSDGLDSLAPSVISFNFLHSFTHTLLIT